MSNSLADKHNHLTKDLIIKSYIELMKFKPFNKITVTDICKSADINRGTFYLHFEDINNLSKQIEDKLFNELVEYLEKSIDSGSTEDILVNVFNAIKENSELCKIYLSKNGNSKVIEKLMVYAFELYKETWVSDAADIIQYVYSYTANGTIGIISKWFSTGMKESPEEMAKIAATIIENGIASLEN